VIPLIVECGGRVRCICGAAIDLAALGRVQIVRASHAELVDDGSWYADLRPANDPVLRPFAPRSDALAAEVDWLEEHWLSRPDFATTTPE
jgi:hypothetical protein